MDANETCSQIVLISVHTKHANYTWGVWRKEDISTIAHFLWGDSYLVVIIVVQSSQIY